jgi:asparagine synthetase B (glutamine-hydrolysing)
MASLFAAFCQAGVPLGADLLIGQGPASTGAVRWQDPDRIVALGSSEPSSSLLSDGDLTITAPGRRTGGPSGAEAILEAYRRAGAFALATLQGEHPFALWDARSRVLLVACDAVGLQAPAYAWNGRTFLLGPSALGLLGHCEEPPAWDEVYIAHALSGMWCQRGRETAFRGVHRMIGSEIIRVSAKGLERVTRDGLAFHESGGPKSLEEVVHLLGERLDRAVAARANDTGACIALSGGLDSCVVATAMARAKPDFDAFSVVPPEGSGIADGVAAALGPVFPRMRCHRVSMRMPPETLREALPLSDDPICAGSAFQAGRFALARAARDLGFECILDGEGGDEIFDQVWWPGDLIRELALGTVLRTIRSGRPGKLMVRDYLAAGYGPAANLLFGRAKERLRARRPWLRAAFWESAAFDAACDEVRAFGALRSARERLPDVLAAHGRYKRAQDQMRRSIGIDSASPLLDRSIVDLVGSLRTRTATDPLHAKVLLRRLAARRVPAAIAWRPKSEPLHEWLVERYLADDSNVARAIEIIGSSPLLSEMVDRGALVDAIRIARAASPRAALAHSLIELFALAEWMTAVPARYFS